ncbi:Ppx/GppA family phosphatase [Nakamurella antarctica]|uniref:Ppx/GppA family phosphatase n=1 Tax=Nakamurella antarctica TaxID=1902245 RepID=A0A3G8ZJC6_9ACTN|nr:Ppx/GppA phosphatase family protein [Nakamurella antarctica]AZI57373.1 Ppx/GppA family phosphatase [Nakamurella antarctica]
MTRVAAIDCGTNSIRLLVADVINTPAGFTLVDVHREMRVVRLGEGVDQTGVLQTGAIDRTWAALSDYTAILRASGATSVRMAATSATRDASNRNDFVEMVRRTLGQDPEVITGNEEAELSFRGAIGGVAASGGPYMVVDIGGGSTEMVIGTTNNVQVALAGSASVNIGCVRLTERLLHSDPPTEAEIDQARQLVTHVLSEGLDSLPVASIKTLVAVAGTATTVAAAALHLPTYDPAKIHLQRISATQVSEVATLMLGATTAHRAALGYMHPGRVDVIGGGSLILDTLVQLVQDRVHLDQITVSEHDILDGLALSLGQ